MYYLERSKAFIKEQSKLKLTNEQYAKLIVYIDKLLSSKPLPPEARDHLLQGDWIGYRELHISGDLLLVYKIENETLYLT